MDFGLRVLLFVLNSVAFYILLSTYASTSFELDLLCGAALAFVFSQPSSMIQVALFGGQQVQQHTHV